MEIATLKCVLVFSRFQVCIASRLSVLVHPTMRTAAVAFLEQKFIDRTRLFTDNLTIKCKDSNFA